MQLQKQRAVNKSLFIPGSNLKTLHDDTWNMMIYQKAKVRPPDDNIKIFN